MKKKILSLVLTVCMVLSLLPALSLPAAASAQTVYYYYIGETYIGYWRDYDEGYQITASVEGDGWTWAYDAAANDGDGAGTLTLTDAYIRGADNSSGDSYGAELPGNTTIKLNGDSTIASGIGSGCCLAVYCDYALTIEDGDAAGTGSLSAVGGKSSGGDSKGLEADGTLTIKSGRVTGLGGTAYYSSYGIYANTLTVSSSADVTGIAGTANDSGNNTESCGVYCGSSASVEGSLTAVGAYANGGKSYGIDTNGSIDVSGGVVTAQGGKSANNNSYGVYGASAVSGTGLLVASSGVCGSGKTSQALKKAPTGGAETPAPLTALAGAYGSKLAVYGDSTTYPSNNILSSTLNLTQWSDRSENWNNTTGGYKIETAGGVKTLTLKNMIIIGTDKTESDTVKGSFGIQGGENISIVYDGVNVVCGGTSASGDSCGILDEANVADGLSLSGDGTLIALGRQAGDSSCGVRLMDDVDTGSLKVSSGKVIALGGDASGSKETSCGLNASKKIQIEGGDVTAVGGAAAGNGSLSSGAAAGAGISVSSGQLVAVGGYASGAGSVSAGTISEGTTIFSGSANVVAVGDGYGVATYSGEMSATNFQLGTAASDTVTLTAMGGDGAVNGKGTTTVPDKYVRGYGGTRTTAGSAVRFRLGDPIITVTHDGTVSGYGDFADGWNAAVGLDTSTKPAAVNIFADWTATTDRTYGTSLGSGVGFYDGTTQAGSIWVPEDKHITLDLNGHTIDRNLSEPCSDYGGWVIANLGTLSICDSGTGGTITGGYTGLNVTGNMSGGGIYNAGTLTLSGGTITKNADGEKGGGVYNAGTFTMNGGEISANLAATGYGGVTCGGGVYNAGTFTMTGGEISGNYSCDTPNEDGGGVYNAGNFTVGGTAKITGNVAKAVYDGSDNTASGGVTDNVYLPSDKTITCSTETPLTSGASIGVTTQTAPTQAAPVDITGGDSADYSGYFTSDKPSCRIQKSVSGQTVQLASAMTGIFGAKFYQPQLWDCQRSPAFPVAGRSFRLSGLKAPYDENLKKVNFAAPASDYVTFEYVSTVAELDDTVENRIVNSLKRYTGASEDSIRAAAVVKEILHNASGTTELSSIGLVWALGSDGFLYTAMDGAFKYSGGVGTYVTFAAHKTGDSIIYTPDKTEPYTYEDITADKNKLAPEDGTPTAPTAVTYQELIRVVDNSTTPVPVSSATVTITVKNKTYSGTTDTNGCVQFTGLPEEDVNEATVQSGTYAKLTYNSVDSPEAVLTYTNPGSAGNGNRQDKVYIDVEYGTNGKNTKGGTVNYIGAGTVSDDMNFWLTSGDTAMFAIKPASGYYVSAATWGSTDISTTAKTGVYNAGAVTESTTLTVIFAEISKKSIFDIHYTTAEVFDVQRSPAFPDTGDSSICFSWLDEPYDTNLEYITLDTGEYIQFDKVSSVGTAGKTDEYTESLQYWTDATEIATAALVEENVYNASGTKVKTLGTGLIWCYNDPAKGFLFTTMDGVLGDCGGVGSYVSFNALRYGSSVTQLTDSADPLQWGADWTAGTVDDSTDPKGQPENPAGDTVDDTQDVTFDFAGKVLKESDKSAVESADVTLTWDGTDYAAATDTNGRFVVSGLPYGKNGSYTVTISGKTFTGELPDLGGVENSKTRTASLTAPEIVFLLPSGGTSSTGTVATPYTITVTKTGSGSVSPLGTATVNDGGNVRVFFTASSGYSLSEVNIDGNADADAKTNGYCKFTGVKANHTVAVTFTSNGGGYSPSTGKAEPVIVDGTEHDIGTKTVTDTTTTVTVDNDKLQEQLASASESVVVPITSKTDTTVAQLVVKNVEDMAEKDMTLSVDLGGIQYNIPSKAVQTGEVMRALGATDPSKVPVNVTITQLKNEDVTIKNGTLQVPPVQFTVTATYGEKTVETEVFTQYVSRIIELSADTDLSKITTAVVKEPDGAERHVPTFVYTKDGKQYAKINSLTNSTYALIYNNQSFADAAGKWYENIVSEMASREILMGRDTGVFDGDASITRAEFAAVLVRALGLPASGTSSFTDVASTDWYAGAVGTASSYGLVLGYTDGSFGPNKNITRQEAMAMIARAAKVAEYAGKTSELTAFSDAASVSSWAISAAQYNVGSGLIVGDNGQLRPNDAITRAESATVVLRLLQKAGLVDVRSAT